jgi:hypothetical protein
MTLTADRAQPDTPTRAHDTARADDVFAQVVARLSRQSVDKHFDAYADVDWDDPAMAIDPADERFGLWSFDPLAATPWFAAQTPQVRARVGLHRIAAAMRIGWEFENVLMRGLLEYAFWLPSSRPQFRYVHHEIVEECQHTLMFQEFANRTTLDVRGMPIHMKLGSRVVVRMSRRFPALFFMFVLGGEDPVDHVQRLQLRAGESHPVVERIMRIHVTEEARHVSFARQYLKRAVPRLGPVRRAVLSIVSPLLLGEMGRVMVFPPRHVRKTYGVPRRQLRAALRTPESHQLLCDAVAKPRKLCVELGLVGRGARLLWKACGIWDDAAAPGDTTSGAEAA